MKSHKRIVFDLVLREVQNKLDPLQCSKFRMLTVTLVANNQFENFGWDVI